MLNKSYRIILTGMVLILVSSAMIYVGMRSSITDAALIIGFVLIGVGILLGFFKMVSEGEE